MCVCVCVCVCVHTHTNKQTHTLCVCVYTHTQTNTHTHTHTHGDPLQYPIHTHTPHTHTHTHTTHTWIVCSIQHVYVCVPVGSVCVCVRGDLLQYPTHPPLRKRPSGSDSVCTKYMYVCVHVCVYLCIYVSMCSNIRIIESPHGPEGSGKGRPSSRPCVGLRTYTCGRGKKTKRPQPEAYGRLYA